MSEVGVDVKGLERLARKLRDDEPINQTMNEITRTAAKAGQDAAFNELQGRGTGLAARSVTMGPDKFNPFSHRVFTRMDKPRSQSIAKGRPTGVTVSSVRLARWLFNVPRRQVSRLSQSEREDVFEVQDAIESGGARPVPFKQRGREAARKSLEDQARPQGEKLVKRIKK